MVKYLGRLSILAVIFLVSFAQTVWAASLEASINRDEVSLNGIVRLTLTLHGAASAEKPDFSSLVKDFRINSTSQSSSTSIMNGSYSSEISWTLLLQPLNVGEVTIPAISVKTDQGVLASQPVKMKVTKASAQRQVPKDKQGRDVYIDAKVSDKTPYRNSPVVFTVRLVASAPVSDIGYGDLKIDGAVVEKQGDPKIYDDVLSGRRVKIVELRYVITPLQSGPLKIPSYVFQGMLRGQGVSPSPFGDPFGGGAAQDPFGVFQDFGFFTDIMGQPFTLRSDEIVLKVKNDAAQMDPWIPAEDLHFSDSIDGADKARVGEPITRRLTLVAKGNVGTALPDLNGKIASESDFRIYPENPQTGFNIADDGKDISGWREETYTLIPKKGGTLTLPEIRVPWWDVRNNQIAYATVPAKTINVSGGSQTRQEASVAPAQPASARQPAQTQSPPQPESRSASGSNNENSNRAFRQDMYLLGGLAAAAVAILLAIFIMMKPKNEQKEKPKQKTGEQAAVTVRPVPKAANEDLISAADLRKASNLDELKKMISAFSGQKAGTRSSASLKEIAQEIAKGLEPSRQEESEKLFNRLEGALYAAQETPFAPLKEDFAVLLEKYVPPRQEKGAKVERLGALNPS